MKGNIITFVATPLRRFKLPHSEHHRYQESWMAVTLCLSLAPFSRDVAQNLSVNEEQLLITYYNNYSLLLLQFPIQLTGKFLYSYKRRVGVTHMQ